MTPSKILFYFCISFIFGIFLSSIVKISQPILLAFLILGTILIFVLWKYQRLTIIGFCILFLVLGIWRHQIVESKIYNSKLKIFNDKEELITLIGFVETEPSLREKIQKFEVRVESLEIKEKSFKISEKILVTTNRYPEYQYGDKLKIIGNLKTPEIFDGFNYRDYLTKDGIYSVIEWPKIELIGKNFGNPLMKTLFSFKNKLKESLNKATPRPQSATLEALFFGDEENISKEWKEKLNLTGTRHITAVSGMNITILTFLILNFLLMLGFWRQQAFYFSIILIIFYILMIGTPASAIRAGIMAGILLLAQYFGRFSSASRAIIFSATFMLLQNPLFLRLDIGFQLSFLATMGLIYLQPILSETFKKIPNILQLRNNLVATISAQIFALPILIYNFGQISIISPITNILILPLIPFLTILGFIFSFIGIFWQSLAQIFSWPAWLGLTYILKIVDYSSKIPWASLTFKNVHWIFLIISYLNLGLIVWRLQESQKLKFLKY